MLGAKLGLMKYFLKTYIKPTAAAFIASDAFTKCFAAVFVALAALKKKRGERFITLALPRFQQNSRDGQHSGVSQQGGTKALPCKN